jgi:hypothetical protein
VKIKAKNFVTGGLKNADPEGASASLAQANEYPQPPGK